MKISILPKTLLSKWSVRLVIVFFLLFAVFQILVTSGQIGGDTFFSNFALAILTLVAGISGVLALSIGIIGVTKSRERSVLVFLAMVIGLLVLIFALGEILFPH